MFILNALTTYVGLGGGFVRSPRTIKDFSNNAQAGLDVLNFDQISYRLPSEKCPDLPIKSVSKNFVGKVFLGTQYSCCSRFFVGLEAYGGYQNTNNDYFKAGIFFGGQALVGVNIPAGIQGAVGFGLDFLRLTMKLVDRQNTTDSKVTQMGLGSSGVSNWSVAPCVSAILSKDFTERVSVRFEGQFVLPRTAETPKFKFIGKAREGSTPDEYQMKYSSSHQRFLISLIFKF